MPQTHRESIEVDAPDIEAARDRGWASLRANRPAGLEVVELVEAPPANEALGRLPREDDDEGDQGLHSPQRGQ